MCLLQHFYLDVSFDNTCFPVCADSTLTCWHKSEAEAESSPSLPAAPCCSHSASLPALIHGLPISSSEQSELYQTSVSACGCVSAGCDLLRSHAHKGQVAEHQTLPKLKGAQVSAVTGQHAAGWPPCQQRDTEESCTVGYVSDEG